MLQGFRGKPAADFEGLEEILVNFSNLVVDFPEIAEIDINPLAISNGKASALDARIIIDKNYDATGRSAISSLDYHSLSDKVYYALATVGWY